MRTLLNLISTVLAPRRAIAATAQHSDYFTVARRNDGSIDWDAEYLKTI